MISNNKFHMTQEELLQDSLLLNDAERIALLGKAALDAIIPDIKPDWPPFAPLIAAAAHVGQYITGEEWIREDALYTICVMIMHFWKERTFVPCDSYPYTFEQTLESFNEEES